MTSMFVGETAIRFGSGPTLPGNNQGWVHGSFYRSETTNAWFRNDGTDAAVDWNVAEEGVITVATSGGDHATTDVR